MICIKNGTIHTAVDPQPFTGDILIGGGKILKIASHIDDDYEQLIEAAGLNIYPGFVEAHCHTGLDGYGNGVPGQDTNEWNDPVVPQLRAIDGINPMDPCFEMAAKAGITCFATGPGSSDAIGGTFAAVKPMGKRIDNMILKYPIAMKCAFGENPKRVYQDSRIKTRMNVAALLRETLFKTKEYLARKEAAQGDITKMPAFDMKLEAMIPVIQRELPLKCHAHRCDDILTVLRIAKEFDIKVTLDHCTDGEIIKKQIKDSGFAAIVGPSLTHKSKYELANKSFKTPYELYKEGILIAITTDSPVVPQEYLPLCAGLAMKEGLPEIEAVKAITINAAKILGLDERIGSLKVGKDADMVICDGSILDPQTTVYHTIIDGEIVYSKA